MINFENSETDDILFVEALCWKMLADGASNRRSNMHHVVVGTAADELAFLRTVILRKADPASKSLFFHTDIRSAKIGEIRRHGRLSWLAYDPLQRSEIRLSGPTIVHHKNDCSMRQWALTMHHSRRCYLLPQAPGEPLTGPVAEADEKLAAFSYSEAESEAGFEQFCVIETRVDWMQWYYTYHRGNRRARFRYEEARLKESVWLTP